MFLFCSLIPGLNMRNRYWIISGKKSSYVQQKLLQNRKMCFSKNILYQYFVIFCTASSLEKFYLHFFSAVYEALKPKENINHPRLFKLGK